MPPFCARCSTSAQFIHIFIALLVSTRCCLNHRFLLLLCRFCQWASLVMYLNSMWTIQHHFHLLTCMYIDNCSVFFSIPSHWWLCPFSGSLKSCVGTGLSTPVVSSWFLLLFAMSLLYITRLKSRLSKRLLIVAVDMIFLSELKKS